MSAPDELILYSPREFAEAIGVGLTYARSIIDSGEIDFIRVGKLIKIPRASIDAWIDTKMAQR